MSLGPVAGRPFACSGDMYWTVPMMAPVSVIDSSPRGFAMPKSLSLASPSGVKSTLLGLTSLWKTPLPCV